MPPTDVTRIHPHTQRLTRIHTHTQVSIYPHAGIHSPESFGNVTRDTMATDAPVYEMKGPLTSYEEPSTTRTSTTSKGVGTNTLAR